MREESLWTARLGVEPPEASRSLEPEFDVVVVGAGFTGLSAAYALGKRGVRVAVLERERVGFGASSRNAGMVLTGLKIGPAQLVRRFGRGPARAMFDASLQAIDLVESIVSSEGIECAFERCGHIEVASKPAHLESFKRTAAVLETAFDRRVTILDRSALRRELDSDAYFGGMLDIRSASLDPARYAHGLALAVRRLGGVIYERAPVNRVSRARSRWSVHTALGVIRAERVIAATGAYTDAAFRALRSRFVPVGSYVIATGVLPDELTHQLIPNNRMIFDSRRLLHYFRRTPDRRMLFGGRAAFIPEGRDAIRASAKILRQDMIRVFPRLKDAGIDYSWGGTLDVPFDFVPHAGELGGIEYALGYAGHGVALATLLGTCTGNALAGEAVQHPFPQVLPKAPLGLYDGRPWFLPFVGAWQRFLDLVD